MKNVNGTFLRLNQTREEILLTILIIEGLLYLMKKFTRSLPLYCRFLTVMIHHFLNPQQLIVLRRPLAAAGRAGLDLSAV